jgi:hypothetical protein
VADTPVLGQRVREGPDSEELARILRSVNLADHWRAGYLGAHIVSAMQRVE